MHLCIYSVLTYEVNTINYSQVPNRSYNFLSLTNFNPITACN